MPEVDISSSVQKKNVIKKEIISSSFWYHTFSNMEKYNFTIEKPNII